MKILAISGRFPVKGGRGDQNRLYLLVGALSQRHEITLVVSEPPMPGYRALESPPATLVNQGRSQRALSTLGAVCRGHPAQTGWMMPLTTWRAALERAHEADVVLVSTSRSIRGPVPAPLVVDHIDSLSFNMARRAHGSESAVRRAAARFEAARMSRWERRVAGWAGAQIAASDEVAELLPPSPPVTVIPAAWDGPLLEEAAGHRRDIDVIFTGDMSYPPNTEGAVWLANEILPLVRRRRPCSAWLVGRHADRLRLAGVSTAANVPDLHAYLKRAKVAVAPVRGRGSPFKTLEAAACGAALVATRWSVACYGIEAQLAETAEDFADGILHLLEDEELRQQQADTARDAVAQFSSEQIASRFEEVFEQVVGQVHRPRLG